MRFVLRFLMVLLLAMGALPAQAEQPAAPAEILVMLHLPPAHFRPDTYAGGDYRKDSGKHARRRVAEALAREHGLTILEDWAMPVLNVDCYRMAAPAGTRPDRIIEALSRDTRVKWAQPVSTFVAQATDPLYRVQPATLRWPLDDIRKTATGRNVTVAVIDSGVDASHPDLAGQVLMQENYVDGQNYVAEIHGTAVASVIAARAGNGVGIEGIAPDARLLALRACWQQQDGVTLCNSFSLGKAMNTALLRRAQVINLSLSGPPDRLLRELIDAACARGVRVVSAVDPRNLDGGFPANYPGVFAVAADQQGTHAAGVLFAPGRDIPTAVPGGRWQMANGSSFSAAHISGMMALIGQLRPELNLVQLRAALVADRARPNPGVDLCATVTGLTGNCTCACNTALPSTTAQLH